MKKVEIDIDSLVETQECSIRVGDKKYYVRLIAVENDEVSHSKDDEMKRKEADLKEIRKKLGAPFIGKNFKPLTRDEIYERH